MKKIWTKNDLTEDEINYLISKEDWIDEGPFISISINEKEYQKKKEIITKKLESGRKKVLK